MTKTYVKVGVLWNNGSQSYEELTQAYCVFSMELSAWLERCSNDRELMALRPIAVEASNLVSATADTCYPIKRVMVEFLEHIKSSGYDIANNFSGQISKLSEIVIYMFHISTAGAVRSTHSLQLKLRNEFRRFSQHSDGIRNVFIMRGHLLFVHYFDKAGNSKGIEFDPSQPTILIPHRKVSSRLLLYFAFLLPLAINLQAKRLKQRVEQGLLSREFYEAECFVLCIKAQYPFVFFGWTPEISTINLQKTSEVVESLFGKGADAYGRCIRRCMIKCN